MAHDKMLTDDYVADLLAKEASDASIKYSAVGLEAFRSTKYVTPNCVRPASDTRQWG